MNTRRTFPSKVFLALLFPPIALSVSVVGVAVVIWTALWLVITGFASLMETAIWMYGVYFSIANGDEHPFWNTSRDYFAMTRDIFDDFIAESWRLYMRLWGTILKPWIPGRRSCQ